MAVDKLTANFQRDARKYKKALSELTLSISHFLANLDCEMQKPSSNERGRIIARLTNELDMANDSVLHFTFGQSFHSISLRKSKIDRTIKKSEV